MFKIYNKASYYTDYFILLLILFIGMWQISLFQNIMKWDIIDINLPWRYFVSECINNRILPLWNPYINCGFPQSGDPMTWYPVSWLTGLLFGNNLITLQYEYIFHMYIGAIGIYKVGQLFNLNRISKLSIAISFMFSGLFISNAQHLGWIISAAWFPLIIYQYILFSKKLNLVNGIYFIIFLFFLLTGGYPGFFIVTAYILVMFFIYFIIKYIKEKKYSNYLLLNFSIAIIFILLSSVVLISSFELSPFLTRYNQLTIDYAVSFALPIKALISFLIPFAVTTNSEFWGADLSLINSYFGIITIVFLIYTLITIRNKRILLIFIIGLLFLSTSLADIFPFRKWIFHLPFMHIFRFPTIFRFFAYFCFIIISGIGIADFIKNQNKTKTIKIITFVLAGIYIAFISYNSFFIEKWKFKELIFLNFKSFFDTASIHDRIFFQSIIQLIILFSLLIVITKLNTKLKNILILLLVFIDLSLATQLNIYHTVVDYRKPQDTQQVIKSLPKEFSIPDINEKIIAIDDKSASPIPFIWRNLNIFHKKTSYTGYSPYYFSSMDKCENENLFKPVIQNPLFFLSEKINAENILDSLSIDSLSSEKIQILSFNPNKVELIVKNSKRQVLTFVQNYYPGWKLRVNKKEQDIIISNYTFMSFWLDAGINRISLEFKPQKTIIGFYISLFVFITLLLFLIIHNLKFFLHVKFQNLKGD